MLEKKVAIVTGGSEGIGFGIASALASEGTRVYLVARTLEKLEAAKNKIREKGGDAEIRPGNILDLDAMKGIIDGVYEENGRLDIFVNNAGEFQEQSLDTPFSDIRKIIELNFIAPYGIAHYLVDKFKGEGSNLQILNTLSQSAIRILDMGLGYSPAKSGLTSALFNLDFEMRRKGIKNVTNYRLYPNSTATEGTRKKIEEGIIQDPTTLESVVDTAMFLLSGSAPTRDVRIGYYPGKGIVRTYLSSEPEDFPGPVIKGEEVVDPNFTPEDLFKEA